MLPSFIIAGTLPAGTGQLYGLLAQHPEIYLAPPMQPECNFFVKSRDYARGLEFYRRTWFSMVPPHARAIGERSSLLLSSAAWAADRVARDVPGVKLVVLLRNPVDRAYANYRFTALAGYEDRSFGDAVACEDERVAAAACDPFWREIQPHAYVGRGLYHAQIAAWQRHVPPERMLILRSDALLKDTDAALRTIHRFLGVDETFAPTPFADFSSPSVIDPKYQQRLRAEMGAGFDAAIQRLREGRAAEGPLDEAVRGNVKTGVDPLPASLRRSLTDRFRDANRRLPAFVSFSIEDWL
jgi:hypothetical protein